MTHPVVIIGGGQAALQAAESLRAEGYDGGITVIGEEEHLPYHRPPLSKGFLTGAASEAQLSMRTPEALARKSITFLTGRRAVWIDRAARHVQLDGGETLRYAGLVIATGSRPRLPSLPGINLGGVLTLRTLGDSRRLAAALAGAASVAIIGGGFIGLEIAAAARKAGKATAIFEAAPRLMSRTSSPEIAQFFAGLHATHGAVVHLQAQIAEITGVTTADGIFHAAGLVVIGTGARANDELAAAAGLECDNGIVVDNCARTADPLITAAGDCTARRLEDGTLVRLESVHNAIEQGKSAAAALMGRARPFGATPWFWSDQYDVKMQMAGLSQGYDTTVTRGSTGERRFSVFYFRQRRLIAADSINSAGDHVRVRKMLDGGNSLTPEQAADPGFDLAQAMQ
jgi:3-phenylpropionate/trans-cinnamate dioxygenase ferredoxin reductase subunit